MTARIGVVGCGWWATRAHLPALTANAEATVAAIADPDAANLAAAGERFEVGALFDSADAMLDATRLDGVVIAVPHVHHHPLAGAALDRGLHVLLEKPMTIRPDDARDLLARSQAAGVELIIGYPWHYNRQVLYVREQLAAGRIGTIEHVSCLFASTVRELYRGNVEPYRHVLGYTLNAPGSRTYSDPAISGGGQAQTQITHSAALLFWLTGLRPTAVVAVSESFELPVDLVDSAAIRFDGGAVGALSSTGSVLPGEDELLEYRIFGSRGHVLFDVNNATATIHSAQCDCETLDPIPPADSYPEAAPASNLVDVCLGRGANGSPAEIGLRSVEFVDAIYRAARSGRAAQIP